MTCTSSTHMLRHQAARSFSNSRVHEGGPLSPSAASPMAACDPFWAGRPSRLDHVNDDPRRPDQTADESRNLFRCLGPSVTSHDPVGLFSASRVDQNRARVSDLDEPEDSKI